MASEPQPLPTPASGVPTLVLELSLKGQPLESRRFTRDLVVVGRHPHCDLWVDNPGVSRQQLRISRLPGGEFQVEDLGSANGTFLNDKPVRTATVRNGDVLQFSKYTLRVGIEGAAPAVVRPSSRNRSDGDGATVMLSPTELRELLQDVRGEAAPVMRSAPAASASTVRSAVAATAAPKTASATARWGLLVLVAVVGALAAAIFFLRR
jgi:pSer/pThr/pTyr-binding forkhead associated (FHA) protein